MEKSTQKVFRYGKHWFLAAGLLITVQAVRAQTWTPAGPLTNYWHGIASSADGSRLIAGTSSFVYISTNSGATWAPTIATNASWVSMGSSADGSKLIAVAGWNGGNGGVFTSTNAGATWTSNSLPHLYWSSVASSADGNTLLVAAPFFSQPPFSTGGIFVSTNGGANWTSNALSDAVGVAMSADGHKMFALGVQFLRSTDSGTTWTQETNAPALFSFTNPSQYLAASADGNRVVLCIPSEGGIMNLTPGFIYISTNSGDSWNLTSAPTNFWEFVASSADGKTIMAVRDLGAPGTICLSTDYGATWSTNSPVLTWSSLAASADGGKLFATATASFTDANEQQIYTYQSAVSPLMSINHGSPSVKLSWLVPSINFVLQQSTDLAAWSNIANSPALNLSNLQNEVEVPSMNGAGFYRLKTP